MRSTPDLITRKLAALHIYQLALQAPRPPGSSFDAAAARRGETIFDGIGTCANCHVPPLFTDPGQNLHPPAAVCTDSFQADRSPTGMYRTTPLKGLFAHAKGGFWHDGAMREITPAQITGNVNDYNPTTGSMENVWRLSSDASRNITGLRAIPGENATLAGRQLTLINVGANPIVIQNDNAGSSAFNRVLTGTGADVTLSPDHTMTLWYDVTRQRWRVVN